VTLSNTWLLEKMLGWNGILAEPARTWHEQLFSNRQCIIDTRCISRDTGATYDFLEVRRSINATPELSTLENFAKNGDWASKLRCRDSERYKVESISLNDLLDHYDAPLDIQFLSLDTEGSGYEILQAFDFHRRTIRSICVEHNYVRKNRKNINRLLVSKGYQKVFDQLSRFDDWYIFANG